MRGGWIAILPEALFAIVGNGAGCLMNVSKSKSGNLYCHSEKALDDLTNLEASSWIETDRDAAQTLILDCALCYTLHGKSGIDKVPSAVVIIKFGV